ncbi:MAG: glycosyltransferase involved in cell wall biosynthesis [Sediminicola sp.]|jgi:glycosyltransferase involved in cell wall biosynthesis
MQILSKFIIPWRIKHFLRQKFNQINFCKNNLLNSRRQNNHSLNILFYRDYDGFSGGSLAVSKIASMLSTFANIDLLTTSTRNLNQHFQGEVKLIRQIKKKYDLIIFDDSTPAADILNYKIYAHQSLVTCHCLYDECHGRIPEEMLLTLKTCDYVHFVDECQQESFSMLQTNIFVIPNAVDQVIKNNFTQNLGCVGDLNQQRKNVHTTIDIFEKSHATELQLWTCQQDFISAKKIISHKNWEFNKSKIYNSFDVLIFLSKAETFGLVIAEALSAGVPCVISDIPAFRHYKKCDAVKIIAPNDIESGIKWANDFLLNKEQLRENAVSFWNNNYRASIITSMWKKKILEIISQG